MKNFDSACGNDIATPNVITAGHDISVNNKLTIQ